MTTVLATVSFVVVVTRTAVQRPWKEDFPNVTHQAQIVKVVLLPVVLAGVVVVVLLDVGDTSVDAAVVVAAAAVATAVVVRGDGVDGG